MAVKLTINGESTDGKPFAVQVYAARSKERAAALGEDQAHVRAVGRKVREIGGVVAVHVVIDRARKRERLFRMRVNNADSQWMVLSGQRDSQRVWLLNSDVPDISIEITGGRLIEG